MEFLSRFKDSLKSSGDFNCFDRYLAPHVSLIYFSAYRLCGNQHDAEDLAQETLYHGLKNFSQLRDHSKAKYWLFSILRNLFLKEVERKKSRVEIEFESFCSILSDQRHPENEFLEEEAKKLIHQVMDKLDDRLKLPLKLFYFENRSYKEISENLGIPIGTVMSRIARAKVYMKRELVRHEMVQVEQTQVSINVR